MDDKIKESETIEKMGTDDLDANRRPSWPYPTYLFLYVVILLFASKLGMTISLVLFFGLIFFCAWAAASKGQYEKLRASYPNLPRSDYVLNSLLFPVVLPLIVFTVLMLFVTDIL